MTAIEDVSQAKLDMKSAENTANIIKLENRTYYAAGYCNKFTFPDGKTKGVLPALGWLQMAYDNKEEVNACLTACGATAMDFDYHWSSTFKKVYSDGICGFWALNWSDGTVNGYSQDVEHRARPFAEYN